MLAHYLPSFFLLAIPQFSIFVWLNDFNQGINILLTADEHCFGRLVEDVRFQIDSNSVSANHCRIYRMKVTNENMEDTTSIFLKDTRLWLLYGVLVPHPYSYLREIKEFIFLPTQFLIFVNPCSAQMEPTLTGRSWKRMVLLSKSATVILYHLLLLLNMVIWIPSNGLMVTFLSYSYSIFFSP